MKNASFHISDLLTSNITNSEPRAVRQAKSLLRACSDLGKRLAQKRNTKFLSVNLKKMNYLVDIVLYGMIILKWVSEKCGLGSSSSGFSLFVEGALEQLGLDPITQILQNLSLPKQIPNAQTARGWDIATTLALAQRLMSLDLLVQLSPDVDSTENGKIVLNVSSALGLWHASKNTPLSRFGLHVNGVYPRAHSGLF